MAYVGMKYPVAAELEKEENGKVNYKANSGFVIGKAISFTGTPNKNDVTLYADDGPAESDKTQRDWGVSLNVDDLTLEVQGKLLGHSYIKSGEMTDILPEGFTFSEDDKPERLSVGTESIAPYFGVGFYKRRRKNNVTSFTAVWLYKTQFSEPTENAETKGESVNFQTPTIEGTAYPVELSDGEDTRMVLGEKLIFKKEADVKKWLEKMACFTENP